MQFVTHGPKRTFIYIAAYVCFDPIVTVSAARLNGADVLRAAVHFSPKMEQSASAYVVA